MVLEKPCHVGHTVVAEERVEAAGENGVHGGGLGAAPEPAASIPAAAPWKLLAVAAAG